VSIHGLTTAPRIPHLPDGWLEDYRGGLECDVPTETVNDNDSPRSTCNLGTRGLTADGGSSSRWQHGIHNLAPSSDEAHVR
jgi:hypothetical protein